MDPRSELRQSEVDFDVEDDIPIHFPSPTFLGLSTASERREVRSYVTQRGEVTCRSLTKNESAEK